MFESTVGSTLATNDFNTPEMGISFYPNPIQKDLNLQSTAIELSKNVTYYISDTTGKIVKKGNVKNKTIDVENLNSGVYFIHLNIDGKKQNFKFIKN
ncbi:hypothetical protein PI23P_03262 [Polaribacter irgensii 23-P]|uniref:Secretion system C-terminal sorting domain-containing protein n=2 Tax=Polaribacter TaxID=52959 RepID=A4BWY9_9FLAO|nr:hypothetical protein PI23P_03262 [Polaribacter irgensii 23-P]